MKEVLFKKKKKITHRIYGDLHTSKHVAQMEMHVRIQKRQKFRYDSAIFLAEIRGK